MSNVSAKTKAAQVAKAQWESRVEYWHPEGWIPGNPVKVASARTKGKKGLSFTYLRHVKNLVTGSEWVDVADKGDAVWSFKPDQVTLKVVKPKRKYTKRK